MVCHLNQYKYGIHPGTRNFQRSVTAVTLQLLRSLNTYRLPTFRFHYPLMMLFLARSEDALRVRHFAA